MKKIIKKLNNFRLTALIVAGVNLIAGICALVLVFMYHFAGGPVPDSKNGTIPSFLMLDESGKQIGGKVMGMTYFLILVVILALAIAIIYMLFPNIINKNKVSPKKAPLIMGVVVGGFQVGALVFTILAVTLEKPLTMAGYIACIPFLCISLIGNFLCLLPLLKCVFYQPSVGSKLCEKKAKAEEAK